MKVLLVNPYVIEQDEREARLMHPYAPMGPLYVAAVLMAEGHEVEFYDATFRPDVSDFPAVLKRTAPNVVGAYTTFLSRPNALSIGIAARAVGAFTVAGGPDANVEPETYLEGGFDAVVLGEGEATAKELVATLASGGDWKEVAGLAHMDGGTLVRSPDRTRVDDLNTLPLPARHLVDMETYATRWRERHGYFSLSVMSSRGCPYQCGFCSRPVFGRVHRKRSVEDVISELRELRERYGADRVRFADDILPINRQWMLELCRAIKEADLGLDYECLARADLMDGEILEAMAGAGFKEVFYGVESGSDGVLTRMAKGQTLADIKRATALTRKAGLVQHWFIMFGYPGETLEDVERTVALILDVAPESLSTTVAYPIRGTPLYDRVQELLTSKSWSRSDDVELLFRNRYPKRFYRWTVFRVHASLWLRKTVGRRSSPVLRAFNGLARAISKVLAVEDELWREA
jgi:radical SAM superfamily enzyme YgiQ (UPF0313 family)